MKKSTMKKVLQIVGSVFLYLLIIICLFCVIVSLSAKKDQDGATVLFGREARIVLTGSMEKCDKTDVSDYEIKDIPKDSLVFIELVPTDKAKEDEWYASLKNGDVLTIKYQGNTITHRISDIQKKDSGGYLIALRGDNYSGEDVQTQIIDTSNEFSFDRVIGKVTGQSKFLGFLVTAFQKPVCLIFIVIVPCLAIITYEIIKLVNILGANRRKKGQEEQDAQQEIEQLKQQLADLQKKQDLSKKQTEE